MVKAYNGLERREFVRLEYVTPLDYKVCKKSTISKLLNGYTANVSQSGLLCNIKDKVRKGDMLWLSFDRTTLSICKDIEHHGLIYQNGVIGQVARIIPKPNGIYNVGVHFITVEEKNITNIYPKIYFADKKQGHGKD